MEDKIQQFIDKINGVLDEWDRVKTSRGLTQQIIEQGTRYLAEAKNGVQ